MAKQAVIIPSTTDLNRGDQALAWEALRFLRDLGFEQIYSIDSGESEAEVYRQTTQSRRKGLVTLRRILPHPRRGKLHDINTIREGKISQVVMILFSLWDFAKGSLLLAIVRFPTLVRLLLSKEQYHTYLAFRQSELIVVKGGGFLHTYSDGLTSSYYIWYQLFYFRLAHRLGIPVVILPNSFGPFRGPLVKWQLRRVLAPCRLIGTRESISTHALKDELGIEAIEFPDMGYFLEPANSEVGKAICQRYGIPIGDQVCVAITVRPYRFPGEAAPDRAYQRYLDAILYFIKYLVAQDMYPVFVTQVAGPGAHENDRLAIQAIRQHLGNLATGWLDLEEECQVLKAVYGCFDYVVGTRFHSVIFAQGCGVPSLAIAYGGNKGTGIMRDLHMGDLVIPIDQVTGESLVHHFQMLTDQELSIQGRLEKWQQECLQQRVRMLQVVNRAYSRKAVL
jgi:colanic acid/amylovoran biosynthesis protein